MAPWWWFPCKPKHVGAILLILKCFNNSTFFNVGCISWKLKCWRVTGTVHEDLCIFLITSRSVLLKMRNVLDKSCRETQNTHIMFNSFFFENRAVYEIIWKNAEGAGHRWQYGVCSLHAGYVRLKIHTLRLCNTHCFSTTTVVAWTRLIVTLHAHCISC